MAKNTNYVSHKKSKLKNQDGSPQLPSASALVEGEIAINFAENVETLSIKNESGHVVTFSSDNYYSEKKLGSAFTGANSAVTVTDALENIEIDVDQVIDSGTSASTNAVATKAVYDAITDNELVWTNAYVAMSGIVSAHTANTEIHVTAADKEKLHTHSNKSALDAITGSVGTMAYQNTNSYSSATEVNTALGNKANSSALTTVETALNDLNSKTVAEIESSNGSITTSTSTRSDGSVKADIQTDASKISGLTAVSDSDEGAAKISGVTSTDSIRKGVENIYKSLASEIAARKAAFLARTISSANKGITVTETPNADGYSTTLALTLDTSTNGSGKEKLGNDNALTITDNGLFISCIWTCGEYND